jgi:hypothetical protein
VRNAGVSYIRTPSPSVTHIIQRGTAAEFMNGGLEKTGEKQSCPDQGGIRFVYESMYSPHRVV